MANEYEKEMTVVKLIKHIWWKEQNITFLLQAIPVAVEKLNWGSLKISKIQSGLFF